MDIQFRKTVLAALLALAFLLLRGGPASGAGEPAAVTYAKEAAAELDVPGMAFAVVRPGKQAEVHVNGVDGDSKPLSADTRFVWGSVSKSLAAATALKLVESGVLGLDQTVAELLPEAADLKNADEITVQMLLSHTSGIGFGPDELDRDDRSSAIEAVAGLDALPLTGAPGSGFAYSSLNYLLVQAIIEKQTGRPYSDVVAEVVGIGDIDAAPPTGHRYVAGQPVAWATQIDPAGLGYGYASGGIDQLASYASWLLDPAQRSLLDSMATARGAASGTDEYGLGVRISDTDHGRMIWHPGTAPGYFSGLYLFPDTGEAVVVLANASGTMQEDALATMVRGIADAAMGGAAQEPSAPMLAWALPLGTVALSVALGVCAGRARRRPFVLLWSSIAALLAAAVVFGLPAVTGFPLRYLWLWAPDLAVAVWLPVAGIVVGLLAGSALRARRVGRRIPQDADAEGA